MTRTRTAMRMLLVAVAIVSVGWASAARAAASAESVERLMQVMRLERQLDALYAQMLPAMQNAMSQAISQQLGGAEAQRMFDTLMPRINAVVREEISWDKLKPDYAAIYAETFTQEEVDGLIAFYGGPLGSALLDKMPQLLQRSMQMTQQRLPGLMQRVMQIAREEAEKEQARSGAKR